MIKYPCCFKFKQVQAQTGRGRRDVRTRSGKYRTNLSGEAEYRSFVPSSLPPDPPLFFDEELIALTADANQKLGVLEGKASRIPNIRLFTAMYVRKEALMSSQIEGTQATLEDILDPTLDVNVNRDAADVVNYIKATEVAINRLKTLPLCNRLLREVHEVLLTGVRGAEKKPGEFRRTQNWIGGAGSTIRTARYVPPNPEDMIEAMSDLEKYINNGDEAELLLIKAALIHYQFETIHPFLDGNGRIGRLLVTLFLLDKGVLSTPALYLSYFLKKNRVEYYDRMTEVRAKGNYEQWVKFFLRATIESAADAADTMEELIALHERDVNRVKALGRAAGSAARLLGYLEESPIFEIRRTARALGVSFNTVASAVKRLCNVGILFQEGSASRSRTFQYKEYLDILRRGT